METEKQLETEQPREKELRALVREFFGYLEQVEVSDSEREFHPTTIASCRCMITARLMDMLPRMKELAHQEPGRHVYWGAGEPDCPKDIKAPNGELHTLKCKVCGLESPRGDACYGSAK